MPHAPWILQPLVRSAKFALAQHNRALAAPARSSTRVLFASCASVRSTSTKASENVLIRPQDFGGEGSLIAYLPNFLNRTEADGLFDFLERFEYWKREVDDFGPQDRKSFYWADEGCTFSYVGLMLKPQPWPAPVMQARDKLNSHFSSVGFPALTGCLANNYETGCGSIVWHCDEVRAHGPKPLIVSLTLSPGGTREFKLKHKETETEMTQTLEHGSLLVMSGPCQQHWLHSLPLESSGRAPHRISLTFRSIVPGFEDAQTDNGSMRGCLE